jgi:CCR4-NOT transcription complex subunit 7/8
MCSCIDREFRLGEDMYAQDSIELLKQSGIDFAQNEARGIDVQRFGELLMSSGIVLNDEVRIPDRHPHQKSCSTLF